MRGILLAFLAASAGLFSVSGQRPDRVEPGRIETVVLDETGSAVLRVDIDHPGVPAFDIFSAPPSVTQLRLSLVEDAEALKAPEGIPILPAGRHDLLVSAAEGYDGGPAEIQGRLRIDPALDAFEPNDTPDAAAEIDLPFHRIVRLADGEWDWFRVDPGRGGVVGIHLHYWGGDYTGPGIRVLDADREEIFRTANTDWSWRGMRYVRAEGRPLYIGVTDDRSWRDNQAGGFKTLEIVRYAPTGAVSGSLVTLGLEADDPSFFQLDLVGEALGSPVHTADEAEAVASELARAVERRDEGGINPWIALLLLIVLAGGGYLCGAYFYRRRSAKTDQILRDQTTR